MNEPAPPESSSEEATAEPPPSRRRGLRRPSYALGLVAIVTMAAAATMLLRSPSASGIGVPLPTYTVDTNSSGRHAQFVGVLGVPILADVDGDLIPDVDILLTLTNIEGVDNPPDLSDIVAGTLTVTRNPIAVTLGRPAPPLEVLANLTIVDTGTGNVANEVSFGYDTGAGGSIPEHFDAAIGGFDTGFNPLTATVDTIGGVSGLTTNLFNRPPTYQGPLTLLAEVGLPEVETTDLALHYQPFPGVIELGYGTDATGTHITYAHPDHIETHLSADVVLAGVARDTTTITADIDRLPPEMVLDLATDDVGGSIGFTQRSSGRKPDAAFTFLSEPESGAPISVQGNIAALPAAINAEWSLDPDQPAAIFDASGAGLGAVDLVVRDFVGDPQVLEPFIPNQPQFVSYQSLPGGVHGTETEVRAHVEHIRHLDFARTPTGITANAQVGDGVMPLQVNYVSDTRPESPDGNLLRAEATIAPLPTEVDVTLDVPGAGDPVHAVVDVSQTADLRGHVELTPVGGGDGCGEVRVVCADLSLRNLPGHVDARFGNLDDLGQGIDIDSTPLPGVPPANISADVAFGPGALDIPVNETTPLFASIDLRGISPRVRARLHTDDGGQLDRAEFHACDWDFAADAPACLTPGPDDAISRLAFSLRNFAEADRPADIGTPLVDTPQFATVIARQPTAADALVFEATGQFRDLSDIALRNTNGILGLRTEIGGGRDFSAVIDIDDPDKTLLADTTLTPLPATLDFCFRQAGNDPGGVTGAAFTQPCEVDNAFGETPAPAASPLSFAYVADDPFGASADLTFVDKGATPSEDHTTRATLNTPALPSELVAHVRMAVASDDCADPSACLPTRVHYDIPDGSAPTELTVAAEDTVGDAVCKDPRPGATASCLSATLENVPTTLDVCHDPNNLGHCDTAEPANNLLIESSTGAEPFNIVDLDLSSVGADPDTGEPQIVVATGQILDIPPRINAALGSNAFDIRATPPIGQVDAVVRNYIAPDPMNFSVPAQRLGLPEPSSQFGAFARGDLFKIDVSLKQVSGAGYRASLAPDGTPLDSHKITVGFDPGSPVRGYADIVSGDDGGQTIGDLTIENNPTGVAMCFRGPDAEAPTAVNPTWCDTGATDPASQGAFEVELLDPAGSVDVHAFVRQADAGNRAILNAVADITGVPPIIRGTMGGGTTEVAGFAPDGTTRQGIGEITFNVADYDLPAADTGYVNAPLPQYAPASAPGAPFPTPVLSGAYLSATATDDNFQARGSIGSSGAHIQRVLFSDEPCAKPDPNRDDYPFFPEHEDTAYTCVRGDVVKDGGVGATPLNLFANIDSGGNNIVLRDAGLTDMPEWFQATISQAPTLNADTSLRRRCGAVGGPNPETSDDCMPALMRVDTATQPDAPILFGVAEFSDSATGASQLGTLQATPPASPFLDGAGNPVDLNENPAAGWGGDTGVRLKVGQFEQADGATATAVRAGVRLPIPGSFTLDQLQSYSDSTDDDPTTYSASDLRAHFVARTYAVDPNGAVVSSLGNLAAMIATFDTAGTVTDIIQGQNIQGAGGGPIPGEVGIDVHARGGTQFVEADPVKKNTYQVDLRLSRPLNVAFHIGSTTGAIGAIDPAIRNIPAIPAGTPSDYVCNVVGCQPGARVRAELVDGPQQGQPPGDGGAPDVEIFNDDFHIAVIDLDLDFRQDAAQTRRIDAVIHLDAAKNGVEIKGFTSVDPSDPTPGLVNAAGSIVFDHFDFDLTTVVEAGFPLGDGDVFLHLRSTLAIGFNAGNGAGTSHFRMRQNVLHVVASSADNPSTVGPIDLTVQNDGDFFIDIDFGIVEVDVDYDAEAPPVAPLLETWHQCADQDSTITGNSRTASAGGFDDAVQPLNDSRISVEIVFDISVKGIVVEKLVGAMCDLDVDIDLMPEGYPSDPVNYPSHPVPQMSLDRFGTTGPGTPAPVPADDGGNGDTVDPGPVPDTTPPLSALLTVPDGPDGAANWFLEQPLGVILAVDHPGGSGVDRILYTLDSGATITYNGPFVIGAGSHTVCWRAVDRAGNSEAEQCEAFLVDDAAPALSVVPTGSTQNGWYVVPPVVTVSATDANSDGSAGSGVAGVFTSVDGGPFVETAGPQSLSIAEGVHTVRAYAVDVAGHRTGVQTLTLRVDLSDPVTTARTFAPAPARNDWWRSQPLVYLRAGDGDQNSGVDLVEYRIDAGPFVTYTGPFSLPSGAHSVEYRSIDVAGRVEAVRSLRVDVDITSPTAIATGPSSNSFIPLLGPTRLNWRVGDDLSGDLAVKVLVYNVLGDVVRVLDGGTVNVPPGSTAAGFVRWDGRDNSLLGILPVGVYHYSVIATDEAGNAAQSGNSRPVHMKPLPLLGGLGL